MEVDLLSVGRADDEKEPQQWDRLIPPQELHRLQHSPITPHSCETARALSLFQGVPQGLLHQARYPKEFPHTQCPLLTHGDAPPGCTRSVLKPQTGTERIDFLKNRKEKYPKQSVDP